jgi:glutaredoxin
MRKLVLYSRPECHLCDAVVERLQPLLAGQSVELEIVDVDSSVALERRYGLRIPVLVAGDVEVSGYPLDEARVRLYLDSL